MAQRWKDLFRPRILARGREYFACGQVVDFEEDDSVIRAQISEDELCKAGYPKG